MLGVWNCPTQWNQTTYELRRTEQQQPHRVDSGAMCTVRLLLQQLFLSFGRAFRFPIFVFFRSSLVWMVLDTFCEHNTLSNAFYRENCDPMRAKLYFVLFVCILFYPPFLFLSFQSKVKWWSLNKKGKHTKEMHLSGRTSKCATGHVCVRMCVCAHAKPENKTIAGKHKCEETLMSWWTTQNAYTHT